MALEMMKQKKKSESEINTKKLDTAAVVEKAKLLKQKSMGKPVILRHNTRPKRSNAGERSEKWKQGWEI